MNIDGKRRASIHEFERWKLDKEEREVYSRTNDHLFGDREVSNYQPIEN